MLVDLLPSLCLLCCACGVAAIEKYKNASYVYDVYDPGVTVQLNCSLDTEAPSDALPVSWLLNTYDHAAVDYDDGHVRVMEQGWQLEVTNLERRHLGYYICLRQRVYQNDTWQVKFGINPEGAYFDSEWELFRWNFIVGIIAAAVFIVVIGLICFTYQCRWKEGEGSMFEKETGHKQYSHHEPTKFDEVTVENPAYTQNSAGVDNSGYTHSVDAAHSHGEKQMAARDLGDEIRVETRDNVTKVTVNNTML